MANPPRVKAVLIDFDQTLVDLPVDWDTLRSDISRLLGNYGVREPVHALHPGLEGALAKLKARGVSPAGRAAVRRKVNALLTVAEDAAAPGATPFPGSRDFIESLRACGVKVIIQSSNSVGVIHDVLAHLAFPRVDAIVGRESARRTKPDPQAVRAVLRRLGLRGDECVVIGDGDFDVQLGRAIGATTIRTKPGRLPGDYNVGSLSEALRILWLSPEGVAV